MGEESIRTASSDRGVEQAIVALKKGAHLLKYGRRGKPKFCPFRLSMARRLAKQCQMKSEKLQECKQRIDEAWSLAREEAAKCKAAAKEVIRALTTRCFLQKSPEGVDAHLLCTPPISTDTAALVAADPIFVTTQLPPEVGVPKDRLYGPCESPLPFCDTLSSTYGRDMRHDHTSPMDYSLVERTDYTKDVANALKPEWVEKEQPGIYITFVTLLSGQKALKRVRFR